MKKILLVLLVLGLLVTACTQQVEDTTSDSGQTVETDCATVDPSLAAALGCSSGDSAQEVSEFTVVGTEFGFTPSTLTVDAGQNVKITFKNDGSYKHNITFDDLDLVTKTISSGETDVLEFTAPAAGTYSFYCSVGSHKDAGMKGAMTVR